MTIEISRAHQSNQVLKYLTSPAGVTIALSIAAEIHAVLNGRDGRSLTFRVPAAGQAS